MKPYIDFNTQKRKEATNEADKNSFKLLNNSAYGKTMENMRRRIKIRITKKIFLNMLQDLHILVIIFLVKIYLQLMKKKNY